MNNKESALSLCNALCNTNYTNADDLQYVTLENALFIRIRNDVSFIFDKHIHLYEHQSTYNPNMPLRGLLYFAEIYKSIIKRSELFRSRLIKIPVPKYYVFYNGLDMKNLPDKLDMYLSDAFDTSIKVDGYEWKATMININTGHNKELMDKCKILYDYSVFIEKIRFYSFEAGLQNGILKAIDECINTNILREVLSKFREEVAYMAWAEYDEDTFKRETQEYIDELKAEIADKDAEIADKDAEIARLRKLLENQ